FSVADSLFFFVQVEHNGVDAVAQVCRARAIIKDMTKMGVATRAQDFCANHPVARINFGAHIVLFGRFGKARPAAARVEFGIGTEQLVSASCAFICTLLFRIVILASERSLRTFLTCDLVLLRRQFLSPFFISLDNFSLHLLPLSSSV